MKSQLAEAEDLIDHLLSEHTEAIDFGDRFAFQLIELRSGLCVSRQTNCQHHRHRKQQRICSHHSSHSELSHRLNKADDRVSHANAKLDMIAHQIRAYTVDLPRP